VHNAIRLAIASVLLILLFLVAYKPAMQLPPLAADASLPTSTTPERGLPFPGEYRAPQSGDWLQDMLDELGCNVDNGPGSECREALEACYYGEQTVLTQADCEDLISNIGEYLE
jgi:hypothetical protein